MGQPAMQPDPPEIVVEAGIDREQLRGLLLLWEEWCEESHGRELSRGEWATMMQGQVGSGGWFPIVAWEGDTPVGMVQVTLCCDPLRGGTAAHGDCGYVRPDHRENGLWRALAGAAKHMAWAMGADRFVVTADVDRYGQIMRKYYESDGFEVVGVVMRRDATDG